MFTILSARIVFTFSSFKVGLGNPVFWICAFIILLVFLNRWGLKKILSFSVIISVLLFLMFKVDRIVIDIFGREEGNLYSVLTKPIFLFLIAVVLIYYAFIYKE